MTRDEPPFVLGPLARAAAGVGALLKVAIRAIGRGPILVLSGLAMLVIFGAVLFSSTRAPDGSVFQGVWPVRLLRSCSLAEPRGR